MRAVATSSVTTPRYEHCRTAHFAATPRPPAQPPERQKPRSHGAFLYSGGGFQTDISDAPSRLPDRRNPPSHLGMCAFAPWRHGRRWNAAWERQCRPADDRSADDLRQPCGADRRLPASSGRRESFCSATESSTVCSRASSRTPAIRRWRYGGSHSNARSTPPVAVREPDASAPVDAPIHGRRRDRAARQPSSASLVQCVEPARSRWLPPFSIASNTSLVRRSRSPPARLPPYPHPRRSPVMVQDKPYACSETRKENTCYACGYRISYGDNAAEALGQGKWQYIREDRLLEGVDRFFATRIFGAQRLAAFRARGHPSRRRPGARRPANPRPQS